MEIDKPNLGDKTFSKVVEMGIASQLDEAEVIEVDIRTNPGKLVQGKLDSVTISGKGVVMKQDLRMEMIEVGFKMLIYRIKSNLQNRLLFNSYS